MPDVQMKFDNAEMRTSARIEHASPVQIKDVQSGNLHRAKMRNYSEEGLYFESDSMLSPGMKIYLGIQNSPFAAMPDVLEYRRGEIQWRKRLKASFYQFGYGVKISADGKTEAKPQAGQTKSMQKRRDLRQHTRKACRTPTLCSADDDLFKGEIQNVSLSGVFISSDRELAVDQVLTLSVPGKQGKALEMTGKVVWCSQLGCGIKILSTKKIMDPNLAD
jgi:hypothetical protein